LPPCYSFQRPPRRAAAPAALNKRGAKAEDHNSRPNIIVILADNLGYFTIQAAIGTNVTSAETDFRLVLSRVGVSMLILHGDRDGSRPIEATGRKAAKLIFESQLKVYEGRGMVMRSG
jgi:pimeloyl-ACP methyl ester carboxylesterase